MPMVSIIVPVHNRERILGETLDSVRSQTFEDWECIVVDDHSTDGSLAAANRSTASDARFRVVSLPEGRRNGNAARNYGLSLAMGQFVNFLDSDDLITRNKLQAQLAVFAQTPGLDLVSCRHATFVASPEKDAKQVRFAHPSNWLDVIWLPGADAPYGATWCAIGPLWRAEFIRSLGAWDETLEVWQDSELAVRALCTSSRITRLEQIHVFVRIGAHQRLSSPEVDWGTQRRYAVRTAWKHVQKAGQVTDLRLHMCALRLYAIASSYSQSNHWQAALRGWCSDCKEIQASQRWMVLGWVRLVAEHFRFLRPLSWVLRPAFRSHRRHLPLALMDLDHIPLQDLGPMLKIAL